MRILIADDHPLFRDALRAILLRAYPQAHLLEVGDIGALYAQASSEFETDLLLLDLNMPGAHGFSALIHLRACYPTLPIMIVSARSDALTVRRALAHGAMGFVAKSAEAATIADAVRLVLSGEIYDPLAHGDLALSPIERQAAEHIRALTPAQFRVLVGLCEGKLNKQIAHELSITEATVKAHVTQVLRKLGCNNRTQAVTLAADLALEPDAARALSELR
jgi:DNA-binding NarL/FixJ family response regulator